MKDWLCRRADIERPTKGDESAMVPINPLIPLTLTILTAFYAATGFHSLRLIMLMPDRATVSLTLRWICIPPILGVSSQTNGQDDCWPKSNTTFILFHNMNLSTTAPILSCNYFIFPTMSKIVLLSGSSLEYYRLRSCSLVITS